MVHPQCSCVGKAVSVLSCFPLHALITVLTSYSMGVEREGGGRREKRGGGKEEEERMVGVCIFVGVFQRRKNARTFGCCLCGTFDVSKRLLRC